MIQNQRFMLEHACIWEMISQQNIFALHSKVNHARSTAGIGMECHIHAY